jgi:hypothetical protein
MPQLETPSFSNSKHKVRHCTSNFLFCFLYFNVTTKCFKVFKYTLLQINVNREHLKVVLPLNIVINLTSFSSYIK